jgi:hypothetical protein
MAGHIAETLGLARGERSTTASQTDSHPPRSTQSGQPLPWPYDWGGDG